MAQPFTDAQRNAIRQLLFESACHHALTTGVRKTSLEMLTADAGISKSSFYKFYESKEQLFLEVAAHWEREVLERASRALSDTPGISDKARAANFAYRAFEAVFDLGIQRFLREDLPLLNEYAPKGEACRHYLSSALGIHARFQQAHIRFTVSDEIVRSVIQLIYLSILNSAEIGESFFPALRELVVSACDRLIA